MSRSLKKGPYVDPKLLEKVNKARETEALKPLEHGLEVPQFHQKWLELILKYIMARNLSRYL
jgi:hypothetical protein